MENRTVTRIFWIVAFAVALIALGSFAWSFMALRALAADNGAPGSLGWIWPLIVDTSMLIYTAAILVAQLQQRAAKLPTALTIFYAVVTITGNILHAPPSALGWFVAALPPLSLIFGAEMLRTMSHHIILQRGAVAGLQALRAELNTTQTELDTLTRHRDKLAGELGALKAEKSALTFEENQGKLTSDVDTLNAGKLDAKQARLDTLLDFLNGNPQANFTEAAQVVNVTRQTVGKYVNELTEAGTLHRNGNGWEVA